MKAEECRKCGCSLSVRSNWLKSHAERNSRICKTCDKEEGRAWRNNNKERSNKSVRNRYYRNGGKSMGENKSCTQFLGVHVAERVLSKTFKDVELMPYGNKGYDFICNKGKKIDVKSACINSKNGWVFIIKRNTTADFFLCLAFDNREDLNILYAWLLPNSLVNHLSSASISKSTIDKWDDYKMDVSRIIEYCNIMKGDDMDDC